MEQIDFEPSSVQGAGYAESDGSMRHNELHSAVLEFQRVIKASTGLLRKGGRPARILCTIYAMESAFMVRRQLDASLGHDATETAIDPLATDFRFVDESLLDLKVIEDALPMLVSAEARPADHAGVMNSLKKMHVFELCPNYEGQISRMETIAGELPGRARQLPLIELSALAVEFGDYRTATRYAREAMTFDPSSYELYNLSTIQGVIAFDSGEIPGGNQVV